MRFTVKIDMEKPLIPRIFINGVEYFLKYENLPSLCYGYGRIGYTMAAYNKLNTYQESGEHIALEDMTQSIVSFGDSMIAQRPRCQPKPIQPEAQCVAERNTTRNGLAPSQQTEQPMPPTNLGQEGRNGFMLVSCQ